MPGTITTIGLADWHIYTHTDGRRTALRQTTGRLFLVIERPNERVEWRRYTDVHGIKLDTVVYTDTFEQAQIEVEQC